MVCVYACAVSESKPIVKVRVFHLGGENEDTRGTV